MKCPICGAEMILQTARRGRNSGKQFYGCFQWRITGCTGVSGITTTNKV